MKRIIILLAVAAALSSCVVYSGDSPTCTAYSLQSKAQELYTTFAYAPVACMVPLEEVSDYLFDMTEDEQAASPVREYITRIGENVYYLEDFGVVNTRGTALGAAGEQWRLEAVSFPYWSTFPGWLSSGSYYGNANNALSVNISCESESPHAWKLSVSCMNGVSEIDIRTEQQEPQVVSVSMSASGSVSEEGYKAEFSTGEEDLLYNVKLIYKDLTCIGEGIVKLYDVLTFGTFGMDIFSGEAEIDNCTVSFMGEDMSYRTSRD